MTGGVVGFGDIDAVRLAVGRWIVDIRYLNKPEQQSRELTKCTITRVAMPGFTYFSVIGPNNANAGCNSFSGSDVSTMVETMATQ